MENELIFAFVFYYFEEGFKIDIYTPSWKTLIGGAHKCHCAQNAQIVFHYRCLKFSSKCQPRPI